MSSISDPSVSDPSVSDPCSPDLRVAVIVVGAGSGSRLGHAEPKAFVPVAGRPALSRALEAVFAMRERAQVIMTVPTSYIPVAEALLGTTPGSNNRDVTIIVGGDTRQQSVAKALSCLNDSVEVVLIHDAARPLTPSSIFDEIVDAVRTSGSGVIPGLPVADTIKRMDVDGFVTETVDRATLRAIQTPQGFPREQFVVAHDAATEEFTDDAALFAAAGHPVSVVDGNQLAFKITTAAELRRAEQLFEARAGSSIRVGTGTDVHACDATKPLWLAGLLWPDEPGLRGHSDGDVVAHAICDALLSAAGLGDLGAVFGTSDPKFENAHGEVFLRETVRLIENAGFEVGNVAVQVVSNHPKIARRRAEAEALIGGIVGAPVSIAGTTSDALGFTGRGEGIAAIATALLQVSGR